MGNQLGRLFNLGWLACAVESEGSISYHKVTRKRGTVYYTPRIIITNSDPNYIEKCGEILKENNLPFYITKRRRTYGIVPSRKTVCDVLISGYKRCSRTLEVLIPILSIKLDRALKLKEVIDYRLNKPYNFPHNGFEEKIFLEMRKLNGTLRDYTPNFGGYKKVVAER